MTTEVPSPEIPWKWKHKQSHQVFNVTYKYTGAAVNGLTVHKSNLATTPVQKKTPIIFGLHLIESYPALCKEYKWFSNCSETKV